MPCLLRMEPKSSKYKEKMIGPKIEPCGTPQDRRAEEDLESQLDTKSSIF
ncbi:hypothetical protein EXN66_Car006101 [Channa argus]|uniref:Uncharacterized protein n=1 Tax=Channa argus TaxID=215402 RepID=A0A6G1PKB2_CHAAH|nr:hypothetical protein EXN66_Car006101 [Channa argus]